MSRERKPEVVPPQERNNTTKTREKLPKDLQKIVDDEETLFDQIYDGT